MLTPGVLQVSPKVWETAFSMQLNHRDPLVREAVEASKQNIKKILNLSDKYEIVFFATSGRGGIEAAIAALVASKKRLLFAVNGRWSTFMVDIARKYDSSVVAVQYSEEKPLPLEELEKELAGQQPDFLCFVGHETEKGLLNPIQEIVSLAKKHNCGVLLDGMSSVVIHDIPYEQSDVDILCLSSTKGIRSFGGVAIVALKKSLLTSFEPSANHYLDLKGEYEAQERNGLTRAVLLSSNLLSLRAASEELLEEGLENRRRDIKQKLDYVKDWAEKKGLEFCTPREYGGNFSASFVLPNNWTYENFMTELHERGYFVAYGPGGREGNTFEVSAVGYLSMSDVEGFTNTVDEIL